ncbi:tetratricopeptide repeat protein [Kitasatospora sp. NPDC001527]|uniref:ATP-binding protein n=1 Tax=Kitasatospora sp. NPDC001527 TaxID=3154519 RepID=UPI00331742FE
MTRELPWKKPRAGQPVTGREVAASGEGAVGAGGDIAHAALGEQSTVEHTELRADGTGRIHQAGRDIHVHEHHHAPLPAAVQSALAPPPAVPAGFTGRSEELEELLDLLRPVADPEPVVVASVLGMGGMGKTTLALAVAHAAIERGLFSGVLFLDLHGYDDTTLDADQVLDAALRALGTDPERIPPGADQRAAYYRAQLAVREQAGERVLVLADNANAAEQVRHLVPGAGPHRLLVTSRDDFTAALGARLVDLDVLDPEQSVALMAAALRRTLPKDRRIVDDPDGAARVAELCGHLPLALQIAAAQLVAEKGLKPSRLADDMHDLGERLDVLEDGPRAVRAVLERSYKRLSLPHAELFRLLAVNPGPDLSTETAAAVTSISKLRDVRARLVALSKASLIRQDPDTGRWHMHDLVRAYAGEQAARHPAHTATALQRLLDHYTFTTHEAEARVNPVEHGVGVGQQFSGRAEALAWLAAERANLVAAVHTAHAAGRYETAQHLTSHLSFYLNLRRRLDDHLDIARIALAAAHDSRDPRGEASAWIELGLALQALRRFEEAEAAHRTALTQHQSLGDHQGEATARSNIGNVLWALRRFEEAEAAHRTTLSQYQALGDHHGEAVAWDDLGVVLQALRRFEEAEAAHRTALTRHQDLGDHHREATAWNNLGVVLQALRRFEEAEAAHRTALTRHQDLGDHHREAIAWNNLGTTLRSRGAMVEAIDAGERAVGLFENLDDRHRLGAASDELADTLLAAQRPAAEVRAMREASAAAYRACGAVEEAEKALSKADE